jgi:acetyl-CoA carboxylase biotin carboxyl carrier protein
MRIHEVRRLIQLVEESEIGELEVWRWWGRIRIRKNVSMNGGGVHVAASGFVPAAPAPPAAPAEAPAPAPSREAAPAETANQTPIKSPMVGTFYRAPAPDAEPYMQVGQPVEPGQTVCIIEAMKLMNEIEAEVAGEVVRVHHDNGQPVQYGEPLFSIRP